MKRLIAAACLALTPAAFAQDAGASVYRWTDRQGQDHYTDDPSTIPEAYRKKAQKTSGRELMEVRTGEPAPTGDSGGWSASSGPDEETWRKRFAEAQERISALEQQLAQDREQVRSSVPELRGGVPRTSQAVVEARARIAENERALTAARQALEALDREASAEAVPREWRRP